MERTIRDKFELLLETRNNDIDNTRTHVAMIDNKLSNMRSTCIIK